MRKITSNTGFTYTPLYICATTMSQKILNQEIIPILYKDDFSFDGRTTLQQHQYKLIVGV